MAGVSPRWNNNSIMVQQWQQAIKREASPPPSFPHPLPNPTLCLTTQQRPLDRFLPPFWLAKPVHQKLRPVAAVGIRSRLGRSKLVSPQRFGTFPRYNSSSRHSSALPLRNVNGNANIKGPSRLPVALPLHFVQRSFCFRWIKSPLKKLLAQEEAMAKAQGISLTIAQLRQKWRSELIPFTGCFARDIPAQT